MQPFILSCKIHWMKRAAGDLMPVARIGGGRMESAMRTGQLICGGCGAAVYGQVGMLDDSFRLPVNLCRQRRRLRCSAAEGRGQSLKTLPIKMRLPFAFKRSYSRNCCRCPRRYRNRFGKPRFLIDTDCCKPGRSYFCRDHRRASSRY